ncbi:MAG: hypothetical protein AAGF11_12695 [Myxococcota bacterium]
MEDFDLTKIPETVAGRLDAVAGDCRTRAADMFEQALADQRTLLEGVAKSLGALMAASTTRVDSLVAGSGGRASEQSGSPGSPGSPGESDQSADRRAAPDSSSTDAEPSEGR